MLSQGLMGLDAIILCYNKMIVARVTGCNPSPFNMTCY